RERQRAARERRTARSSLAGPPRQRRARLRLLRASDSWGARGRAWSRAAAASAQRPRPGRAGPRVLRARARPGTPRGESGAVPGWAGAWRRARASTGKPRRVARPGVLTGWLGLRGSWVTAERRAARAT